MGSLASPADLWPSASYEDWSRTCDTLHAHTQVLGKIAAKLAPPEPQLQHAALRLTGRGWKTAPLPAADGSGALVVALDLHSHEAVAEHSDGRARRLSRARCSQRLQGTSIDAMRHRQAHCCDERGSGSDHDSDQSLLREGSLGA